jgi:hypothetical protein
MGGGTRGGRSGGRRGWMRREPSLLKAEWMEAERENREMRDER